MMSCTATFRYRAGDSFQAIRLPYGRGRLASYVLLPDKGSSLAALGKQLTPERWEAWLGGMAEQKVRLSLPRFRAECSEDLVPPLASTLCFCAAVAGVFTLGFFLRFRRRVRG